MAAGGAESADEPIEAGTALAQRRIVCPTATRVSQPHLVIWLRALPDRRRNVFRTLNILDEFNRECLAIKVERRFNGSSVIDALSDLFIPLGAPAFIRSDNGPEFVAQAVRDWIAAVGARTAYIESGSPWENGYCESFNVRFRDELLNGEIFYSPREAQVLIEQWRRHYNTKRPHSALGYRPPVPETVVPINPRPIML